MKKLTVKFLAFAFVIGVTGVAVTACNTVEGVGKDVQAVGKGVSKGAAKTKSKL